MTNMPQARKGRRTPDVTGELAQASREADAAQRSLARMPTSTPDEDADLWHMTENGPDHPILWPDFALDD